MRKLLIIGLIVTFYFLSSCSWSGEVEGVVSETDASFSSCVVVYEDDKITAEIPIKGVKIVQKFEHKFGYPDEETTEYYEKITYTDKMGNFKAWVSSIPQVYKICFYRAGYQPLEQDLIIPFDKKAKIKCYLAKKQ